MGMGYRSGGNSRRGDITGTWTRPEIHRIARDLGVDLRYDRIAQGPRVDPEIRPDRTGPGQSTLRYDSDRHRGPRESTLETTRIGTGDLDSRP
ncbi:hypothetical protein Zmor_002467 [Zophobas morio]|uniref:Uncharacterized protein n=1 Tax=Zophobas morio TaxID=2755281 RepID=A0AA38MTP2_9CUCU|nr:hypothetical protein Zmor_002467 [Zophobas morio]